jgi:glycosyltransferase involved in cell wall biosynthesis
LAGTLRFVPANTAPTFCRVDRGAARMNDVRALNLVIVHYHLRPGGIRRVIELATPHLIREFDDRIERIVLACGEANDQEWNTYLRRQLAGLPVEFFIEPAFHYFSEQRRSAEQVVRQIRIALGEIFSGARAGDTVVWAHNLGIGRNLLLTRELTRACGQRNFPLLAHHHDWWFDNRWVRWQEARRCGFRSLRVVAETVFPSARHLRHVAINRTDAKILGRHFGVGWLPNPAHLGPALPAARVRRAKDWLRAKLGDNAPVWLMPCRLLRRKNIAEALLLTRWLRPQAWLVTTGGVSSRGEQDYANRLAGAARGHGWRLRLGILDGAKPGQPGVAELLAACENVLLTSIQEGFGLPYLEAAAARRPLVARAIPNIAPDLAHFGFRFPQCYDDVLIDPRLFGWQAEWRRQRKLFRAWKNELPTACRRWTDEPEFLAAGRNPRPVPFSRLTLTAQLEVLAQPVGCSWELCARLNPFLPAWRRRAEAGRLQITPWPRSAAGGLSGRSYARRFQRIVRAMPRGAPRSDSAIAAQEEFIRERLGSGHLFPLLWLGETPSFRPPAGTIP